MKTNARILAWLLSICLIAGILPAMPANYAQAASVITYDFTTVATNATTGLLYFTTDAKDKTSGQHIDGVFDNIATYEITTSLGSAPFEIFYAYKDGGCYAGFYKGLGLALNVMPESLGSSVRMNMKVTESGWYTLSSTINNATSTSFSDLSFALYPNTENTIENVAPVFDSVSPAFYTGKRTATFNNNKAVYLDANTTYVGEFSAKACTYTNASGKGGNIYIYNLIATPAAAPVLDSASEVKTAYTAGEAATTVSFTVDGAAASSVSASSDSAAVYVRANGSAVTFTPVSAGTANVTVSASYGGGTIEKVYTITVSEGSVAATEAMKYNFITVANNAVAGNVFYYFTTDGNDANEGQNIDGVFDNVATYDVTAALGSAPFEIFHAYKDGGCYAAFYTGLGIALYTRPNGPGSAVRMNLKVTKSGWYTLSSNVNNSTGDSYTKLNLALYPNTENTIENVTPIFNAPSSAFYIGNKTAGYNGGKPVYLSADTTYVAEFSAKGDSFANSKTGIIFIKDLTATPVAAPVFEPASEVKTAYTLGEAATTVSFNLDGAAAGSVSAASDNSAVYVRANGSAVTFTPVSAGTANVTVSVSYGGVSLEKVYAITVTGDPKPATDVITYDFVVAANNAVGADSLYYFTTDAKDKTNSENISGAFDDVATFEVTSALGSDPYEIFYAYKDGGCYAGFYKGLGLALNVMPESLGSAVRMNLKVKKSGWYTLSSNINNATATSFCDLSLALYPDTENTIENVTPIFNAPSQAFYTGKRTANFNGGKAVYLDADTSYVGELSAKACTHTNDSGKGGNIYIYNLVATPVAAPTLEPASEVKTEYTAGDEATTVSFTVAGVAADAVSVISDSEAVAVSADGSSVTFTPVSAGTANVTVSVNYSGVILEKVYTITVAEAEPEPTYEQGDVNGDGKTNTRDVTTLRRYLAGGYEDSITFVAEMIDVNGDGRENTRDVAALRAIIAG